ncbi:MAG: hypothetical protein N3A61_05870 [Ignavibacteria bacterium]|nr:hypothetical protein [Ignavibacteria bacterium]
MEWVLIIGLILLGFLLIFLEVILLPGILVGIIGFCSIVIGIILAYSNLDSPYDDYVLLATILLGIAFIILIIKLGVWRKFILTSQQKAEEGFTSAKSDLSLIGQKGEAVTNLRPTGIALINDKRVDVLADGEFLEKGDKIIVVDVKGSKILVKKNLE